MMDIESVKQIFNDIISVQADTQYWLIRSMGGDYFKEYITRGYVAIGYNDILLNEIRYAASFDEKACEKLKEIIDGKEVVRTLKLKDEEFDNEDNINSQYASIQLLKFYRDIKIGDIIVIPGRNSDKVAIAKIESDVYEESNVSNLDGICNFRKRRKIHLLRETFRSTLNPKMQLMFNSRHIISNADSYASYIDNCISDFFQKDGYTNLVLRVQEQGCVRASDFGLISDLIDLVKDFSDENGLDINTDDIKAKMCVQSPGDILMYALSWEGITLIGLIIICIKGGEISYSKEKGLNVKVNDIFKSISEFLDRKRDRNFKQALQKKLENMKIDTPEDLNKILKEFNDKRESY